jgi:hypothetical protein
MEQLERQLDSFSTEERKKALEVLWQNVRAGRVELAEPGSFVNLHCHTFFSYNTYGYSPSKFAWLARKRGLAVAGIVDFDVLDGLEEFTAAARLLNLRNCAGLETRVYVPEFADKEMTSPGEPGITYHMGVGFPSAKLSLDTQPFLSKLRQTAQNRNIELMHRVNRYLQPVQLDYGKDVLPLTPAGNATERHLCLAYARKARKVFADEKDLACFWSEKLSSEVDLKNLPDSAWLLNLLRAKTMKRGGVGYVQPDAGAFPKMEETNRFVLAAGGIPTLTWLDGTSDGEQDIEKLLELAMAGGVAAINTIPDRNFIPGVKDKKLENLYQMVDLAERLHLPVIVGTEMNSSGQKFVDDFGSRELAPLLPVFLKGAYIAYAHSVLQRQCGLGYSSQWAQANFSSPTKNDFFESVGKTLQPAREVRLKRFAQDSSPDEILKEVSKAV